MLGNETAEDLTRALNRFKSEELIEALDRNTTAMQNLAEAIERFVRSLPEAAEKKPRA